MKSHSVVLFILIGIIAISSCVKADEMLTEPYTGWQVPAKVNDCAHTAGGYIYELGFTYAVTASYACDTAQKQFYAKKFKVYTTWITNYVYNKALTDILASTKPDHSFEIVSSQQLAITPLIGSITETLRSENIIDIEYDNGVTVIKFNGVERGRSTTITKETVKELIVLVDGGIFKTF